MNSLTKYLLSNFYSKQISLYKFIFNEIRFTSAQYYTFINNESNKPSEVFKTKDLRVCKVFTLPSVKNSLSVLNSKFQEVLKSALFSREHKRIGFLWYQSLDDVNVKEFFTLLEMPDTFYSRFKIIELHVWMLLYHLPQNNRFHKSVRYGLIEAMWLDTEKRAKITEKYNVNFTKNMRTFYRKFKVTLLLYDEGFYGEDKALTSALWFAFFDKNSVIDPRFLEALVSYVRYQMNHLNGLNLEISERLEKKDIWLPLEPHVKKIFNVL